MQKINMNDLITSNFSSSDKIIKNSFPKEIGKDYMEKTIVQDGLLYLRTKFDFIKPTQIESKQDDKKLVLAYAIKGDSDYKSKDAKENIAFNEGFTTISLFNNIEGARQFHSKRVEQIRLVINESFLERNFEETILKKYYNNKTLNVVDFSPTLIESKKILTEIAMYKDNTELNNLFLESKILELLYLELNKLDRKKELIKLDLYDKKQINKAREILFENIKNPPTIVQLSKQVHLSEVKLKKGFKQLFNETPHKLLSKYKMNEAKKMLESGEYNINEVSFHLGFKYPNNFSNAFFKEFKILPKDILKSKKYY